ncbi:hypothetical protein BGZ97_000365 [Linnemannia gamsii]|uniref:Uncharacterized protein n=1 Tax=Linnemannia gamsii TaxID=64522 RepID=A0A9P6R2K2_9FUNG|nr:hypothetical protein BGZ97_000365 [Linnemannia gamsii]
MFSRATSGWTQLSALVVLTSFLATSNIFSSSSYSSLVSAAVPGFCPECETYAMVVKPCGGTFEPKDIAIDGTYNPLQSDAACVCKSVIQRLLWNCAKCMSLSGGKLAKSPPPQQYQMTCQNTWAQPPANWNAAYTGPVAPGTTSPLNPGGTNPTGNPPPVNPDPATTGGNGGNGGNGNGGSVSGTASGSSPSGSGTAGDSTSGTGEPTGPNGTAIGISLGIIGVAAVGGAAAVVMMKRRRRRHTPLELDDSYVGLDNQWEKPPRPQSPPMMPAPIASGARAGAGGAGGMGRPSPFESRPGNGSVSGGGSVIGGYDGSQYDQYDYHQGGGSTVVGSNYGDYDDGYGNKQQQHGGYNNQGYGGYGHHDQGYPPHDHQGAYNHDYGYDHPVPTSNAPYHGGR